MDFKKIFFDTKDYRLNKRRRLGKGTFGITFGITDAMRYLHLHNILHRDLKLENVLVDENYYPKVCDFGLSICFPETFSKSLKLSLR